MHQKLLFFVALYRVMGLYDPNRLLLHKNILNGIRFCEVSYIIYLYTHTNLCLIRLF